MTPKSGNPTGPGGRKPRPDAAQGLAFGRPRQGNRKARTPGCVSGTSAESERLSCPSRPYLTPASQETGPVPQTLLNGRRNSAETPLRGRATCAPEGDGPQEALGGGPRSPTRGTPGTALEQGAPDAAKPARGKAAPLLGQQFAQRNRPPRGTVVPLCRCSHGRGQNAPSVLRATESLAGFD